MADTVAGVKSVASALHTAPLRYSSCQARTVPLREDFPVTLPVSSHPDWLQYQSPPAGGVRVTPHGVTGCGSARRQQRAAAPGSERSQRPGPGDMACGGPVPSQPLPTVLVSARAWLEDAGSGRDTVHLQLSAEPERAGDFRLSVRRSQAAAQGPAGTILGDFQLRNVSYDMKTPRCHELSVLEPPGRLLAFNFDDEREAQRWWTVVSSSLREARRVAQLQAEATKHRNLPDAAKSPTTEDEPLTNLCTKEDLAVRLGRSIVAGDQKMAALYASDLARQKIPLQIQLKPLCYPKSEICMKVGVEDASASVNISMHVSAHTTIAALKQQIFNEYQFLPNIQRWIIGQCLCSDDRTVASYGIRKDGDTAFLYLLGAKQTMQDPYTSNIYQPFPLLPASGWDERAKFNTVPTRSSPRNGVSHNLRPEKTEQQPQQNLHLDFKSLNLMHKHQGPAAPPSPAQPGWSCPQCTFINKPTRPGCEMCSAARPTDYTVPEEYKPDETERRRLQLEKDSYQQYKKEKGRREAAPPSQQAKSGGGDSLDDFTMLQ